ncbi:MAG: DNA replication/repair protein RecF [Devosiaceae bacterium]|nr:DNA replication/repair protein RecF [Devosiaceae bacterium MH13]
MPLPSAGPAITRLTLTGFRNHAHTMVRFAGAQVAFVGPNGAGKTNLLEALSLLSPGRGLRRARYSDMIKAGPGAGVPSAGFAVAADLMPTGALDGDEPVTIGTGLATSEAGTREIRINGVTERGSEALLERLSLVWLTPAMDGLFTGGASDRRRFFDRMTLALHPGHGKAVTRFEAAMRARNKLFDQGAQDALWFDGVEAQMAEASAAVMAARRATLDRLRTAIVEAQQDEAAFPHATLALDGFDAVLDGAEAYQAHLADHRRRDRAAGRALDGPHRMDVLVRHGPKDVEARLASTGEQKALLIGLILAQARLIRRETGQAAVLLLDEVAAHLDAGRRQALFALCAQMGGQTFMTGTDANLFDALPQGAERFSVDEGAVKALSV